MKRFIAVMLAAAMIFTNITVPVTAAEAEQTETAPASAEESSGADKSPAAEEQPAADRGGSADNEEAQPESASAEQPAGSGQDAVEQPSGDAGSDRGPAAPVQGSASNDAERPENDGSDDAGSNDAATNETGTNDTGNGDLVFEIPGEESDPVVRDPKDYTIIDEEMTSGRCGPDAFWEVTETSDGMLLEITGEGDLYESTYNEYYNGQFSWANYKERITEVRVGEGITSLSEAMFSEMPRLKKAVLPQTLTSLPASCFGGCPKLTEVQLGYGIEVIGSDTFNGCLSLRELELPDSISTIEYQAFFRCTGLTLYIPNSVTHIDNYAFAEGMVIYYQGTEGEWNDIYYGSGVTVHCDSSQMEQGQDVTSGTLDGGFTWEVTEDGILRVNGSGRIGNPENVSMPYQTKPWDALAGKIRKIEIGEGITSIGTGAFNGVRSFSSIALPSTLTKVDGYAFTSSELEQVVVPSGVTYLGEHAFYGAKSIYIPSSVQYLGDDVIGSFTAIYYQGSEEMWQNRVNGGWFIDQGSCHIICGASDPVHPTGVTLNYHQLFMDQGETAELTAAITPENASSTAVLWRLSPIFADTAWNNVILVDNNSDDFMKYINEPVTITTDGIGVRTITAQTIDGAYKDVCVVKVCGIAFEHEEMSCAVGETLDLTDPELTGLYYVNDGSAAEFVWTSQDPSIADIDENGILTAYKQGVVTLTVTDGKYTADTVLHVTAPFDIYMEGMNTGLTYDLKEWIVWLVGDEPDDAVYQWESSNPNIATVDENGILTALEEGEFTLRVTCGDYYLDAFTHISSSVHVDLDSGYGVGTVIDLSGRAYLTFDSSIDSFVWSSSDPSVAEVTSDNKLKCKAKGTAVLTASTSTEEGVFKTTFKIHVLNDMDLYDFDDHYYIEDRIELNEHVYNANDPTNTGQNVSWSVSDTDVADIELEIMPYDNGEETVYYEYYYITFFRAGTLTLTATSKDTGVSSSITLTVVDHGQTEHTHEFHFVMGEAPDCTNGGQTDYWVCDICGKIFRDEYGAEEISYEDTLLPAEGHSLVHEFGYTVGGETEYWYCENCGRVFRDEDGLYETELAEIVMAEEFIPSVPSDIEVGEVVPILLTILPANTTNKTLAFDYSDPGVAEIYQEEGTYYIRGLRPGNTDIGISTMDGSNLGEVCYVTVHGETSPWLEDYDAYYDSYDHYIELSYYNGDQRDIVVPGSGILDGMESDYIRIDFEVFPSDTRSLTLQPGVHLPYNCPGYFSTITGLEELHMSGLDVTEHKDMSKLFEGCGNLQTIDLTGWDTSGVTKISRMFKNCSSLEELDLSSFDLSSLAGVNEDVFEGMTALRVIRAPLHLEKEIALPAVFSTPDGELVTSLPLELSESITLTYDHPLDAPVVQKAKWKVTGSGAKRTLTFYGNGTLKGYDNQNPPWKSNRKNIIKVVFENGVTDMGDLQFYSLQNVQTVVIGSGIQVINPAAFGGCAKLKSVKLSEGLKEIRSSAFMDCTALKSIVLPESMEMLGEYSFSYSGMSSINFPENLEVIAEGVFTGSQFQTVTIPSWLTRIPDDLFYGCTKLQSVTIPDTVTCIGNGSFGYCPSLSSIDFPAGLQEIGSYAFSECSGIDGYVLPEGIRKVGERAFLSSNAGYIVIPESLEKIEGDTLGLIYQGNIYYAGSREQFDRLFDELVNEFGSWEDFEQSYNIYCGVRTIIPAESIAVELPELIDFDASTGPITAQIGPDDATCQSVTLESSDRGIVSVYEDEDGWHLFGEDDGWARITASAKDGSGTSYSQIVRVSGNTAYNKNKFSVIFNANGGTGTMKTLTGIPYKTGKALTANAFKRKGYKFVGWNTSKDGSGLAIANKGVAKELTRTNNGKVTLYAQWELIDYTINYVMNSGEEAEDAPLTRTYTVIDAVTLQKPVREYYVFSGWYSDSKFKTKVTAIKKGTTGNKTYYAKWTPNKYKITFVKNGATGGKMADMTGIAFNAEKALTANAFTRKGYKFVGWTTADPNTEAEGEIYANKAKVKGLSYENGATVKLYALWEIIDYKITYNLNGGTNSEENPATYQVITDTITFQKPTRTGYTFNGWYSDKKFKTKVTTIKKGSIGNRTLYAKWTANKYTVIFNKNDEASPGGSATGTMKNQTLTYNSTTKLTANAFKKKGYTMTGWNTAPDGTGDSYANAMAKANVSPDNGAKVTLYAQWKLTDYKINYNVTADVDNTINPATYTMDDETFEIQAPTRPGYDFVGWYADAKLTKAANLTIEKGSTAAKTFYPKWTAHTYYVVFDKNESQYPETPVNGTMARLKLVYGSSAKLTANAFKKTGYTMTGWNTKADGSGTAYANAAAKPNVTTENEGEVILYAQWTLTQYKITYKTNGGTLPDEATTTYTYFDVENAPLQLPEPAREGYTFQGWYTNSKFTTASRIKQINVKTPKNVTVYAKWKKK